MSEHDEISRSRKISWDLATRILAWPWEILFYFSSPSWNSRFDRTNSRSRLEARDIEDTNLDLVLNNEIIKILISSRKAKKQISIHIFSPEIFCTIISKHLYCFFHLQYGIYVVYSHIQKQNFPQHHHTTFTFTRLLERLSHPSTMSWDKLDKSESWHER